VKLDGMMSNKIMLKRIQDSWVINMHDKLCFWVMLIFEKINLLRKSC